MSQVFVSYAGRDRAAALPIIETIRQTGLSVWHPDAMLQDPVSQIRHEPMDQVRRELETAQCVVVLWSQAAAKSEFVQLDIHHAIQAWSSDRLVLAVLDNAPLPVGLRDLAPISFQRASGSATQELVDRVQAIIEMEVEHSGQHGVHAVQHEVEHQVQHDEHSVRHSRAPLARAPSPLAWIVVILAMFVGLVGGLPFFYILSAPPAPSAPPKLSGSGLNVSFLMLLVLSAASGAGAVWVWTLWSRRRWNTAASSIMSPRVSAASTDVLQVFVSYSQKDQRSVEQVVQHIEQLGYAVWIDRKSGNSQRYAGPIVRAIRASRFVALMCSRDAFSSDHVVREVYIAGDHKKPFIVFHLDPSEFPDELLYFVSGYPRVQVATINPQQLRSEIARLLAS